MSALDKLDFIRRAKQAGYFVRIFFIGTDNQQSMLLELLAV